MANNQSPLDQLAQEELARRGDEIYERVVRPMARDEDHRKFVAIDVASEDFVIDANLLEAARRLRERHPDAQVWLTRVGQGYLFKFGGARTASTRQE